MVFLSDPQVFIQKLECIESGDKEEGYMKASIRPSASESSSRSTIPAEFVPMESISEKTGDARPRITEWTRNTTPSFERSVISPPLGGSKEKGTVFELARL